MKPFLVVGFIFTLAAGSFVVGRIAATRHGSTTATTTAPAADTAVVAEPTGAADRAATPGAVDRAAAPGLAQLFAPAAREVSDTRDSAIEPAPLEEIAAATVARHGETDARLTKELGKITDEQRRLLMDLNDRAIEFQRRVAGEFQRGTISHEEYMQSVHDEVLNQLKELSTLVAKDQYKVLTGLEPGADPFDFMTAGAGEAQAMNTGIKGAP